MEGNSSMLQFPFQRSSYLVTRGSTVMWLLAKKWPLVVGTAAAFSNGFHANTAAYTALLSVHLRAQVLQWWLWSPASPVSCSPVAVSTSWVGGDETDKPSWLWTGDPFFFFFFYLPCVLSHKHFLPRVILRGVKSGKTHATRVLIEMWTFIAKAGFSSCLEHSSLTW